MVSGFLYFLVGVVLPTLVFGETRVREVYYPPPQPHVYHEQAPAEVSRSSPRLFDGMGGLFDWLPMESIATPVLTTLGIIVGVFGFFQVTNWILDLVTGVQGGGGGPEPVRIENIGLPVPLQLQANKTESVGEGRRKRRLGLLAEKTLPIIESIESAHAKYDDDQPAAAE